MTRRLVWLGALVGLIASGGPVQAAPNADSRWLPFEGCWRPTEAAAGSLLCVVSDGDGVRMIELANGSVVRETRMVADGQARPVSQEGCSGTESVRWSAQRPRLYLETKMSCGQQIARNTTGLFALLSATEWVSVQAIAVDQEAATRIVRYQLVETPLNVPATITNALRENRLARETARMAAGAKLDLTDVSEAASNVHGRAVEALLFERKQVFDLNGKKLIALADAGVPEYLIDAVVAVSNPEQFAVRDARPSELEPVNVPGNRRAIDSYCDDFWYDRFCSAGRYGFGYGYSRFGSYGGYSPYAYGGYGFYSPPVVIIRDSGEEDTDWRHGSVTRRGYSSGSRSPSSTSAGRSVSSSGYSGSRSSSSGSSSSGSSSSSSGSSSSSSSRGQAKPRGGN